VKLALSVFCESTRDALYFYAEHEGKTAWHGTADFISLIISLWNVMNVKTCSKGKHKRNETMDPIRTSCDWQLDFLKKFADFVQRWEVSNRPGLTRETFLALRHTCLALSDCATYLLDQLAFDVVLLGHLQSDPIESRFGWLRQMSGANYYISTKQVLDSDRKIRAVSLLKFSHMSLSEIDNAIHSSSSASRDNSPNYDDVADDLNDNLSFGFSPSTSDLNIIFYISGYIARSVCRTTRCDHCNEALSHSEDISPLNVDDDLPYTARAFFDSINRGGLKTPTELTFSLTVHCWRVYEEIRANSELMTKFLRAENQNKLFYKIMDRATCHPSIINCGLNNYLCTQGHNLTKLVVQRFFNCVAKNLVRHLTNAANQHGEPSSKRRKIAKLGSKAKE
jgi:hypothetical protein